MGLDSVYDETHDLYDEALLLDTIPTDVVEHVYQMMTEGVLPQ